MKKHLLSFFLVFLLIIEIQIPTFAKTPFFQDPDAIQHAAESVLMLTCYYSAGEPIATGSGFLAFEDGVIVTNYHVIEGKTSSIIASTEDGLFFEIDSILCFDETNDIAILKTKAKHGLIY